MCVLNIIFNLAGSQKRIYSSLGFSFEKPRFFFFLLLCGNLWILQYLLFPGYFSISCFLVAVSWPVAK